MAGRIRRFFRRRKIKQSVRKRSRLRRYFVWALRIAPIIIAIDLFYIIGIWPNWDEFGTRKMQKSNFIKSYEARRASEKTLPRLRWRPVRFSAMPKYLRRAVIVAEDARFYSHNGFDLIAFKEAMDTNLELMRFKYGGSTISQQTIKNIYFSGSRNPLRKWHELVFTIAMELYVDKDRILTTYLNIAEFGKGVYGVEAAAKRYWNISADELNERQAAELAATLPSPVKHNPATRTKRFLHRTQKIHRWMMAQKVKKQSSGRRIFKRF